MTTDENKEYVYDKFQKALQYGRAYINLWYDGYNRIINDIGLLSNDIKSRYIGKVFVGYEFKNHLFDLRDGGGDCENLLVDLGEIK